MDLSKLNKVVSIADVPAGPAKVEMTALAIRKLKLTLQDENRANVYPNRFDVSKQYQVTIKKGKDFINFGEFTDVEVATAIGVIAGLNVYGLKARRGSFDAAIAQVHPEYIEWCDAPENAVYIETAEVVLMEMDQLSA